MYRSIRDYAIIGNLRSAALVSKDGSIDWAPAPFIDSPSVFAALLDDKEGGFWQVAPDESYSATQSYIEETNVLKTVFTSQSGVLELIDFFPIEEEKTFVPAEHDTTFKIKRRITCLSGSCRIRVLFVPRFDYARGTTELRNIDRGVYIQNGSHRGVLVSHHPYVIEKNRASARIELSEGESEFLVFRYNTGRVALEKDNKEHHNDELEEAIAFWREWTDRCDLDACPVMGPWQDIIVRSALVLKILFFETVGTVAAAPTTSLPEAIGGVRNWDYRYTWLRDSSFIFEAFFRLGHVVEAETYLDWLIANCYEQDDPAHFQIMYGLRGERELSEEILTHLEGYEGSQPVRVGNDAYLQQQWDIYGSIFDVVWQLHSLRGKVAVDEKRWRVLRAVANYVADIWEQPDEGLWEVRSEKAHYVYSKVMCWVALDRAVKLSKTYGFEGEVVAWERERDRIREAVLTRGFSETLQSFTQQFDSENLDAAVLLLPAVGFIDGKDPKMISTIRAVQAKLSAKNGLLVRYTSADGLPGREGAFILASFWMVNALLRAGAIDEAESLFNTLVEKANHVGLFSEEIDPVSGAFLGNFPQAYTHVGLINSAIMLSRAKQWVSDATLSTVSIEKKNHSV